MHLPLSNHNELETIGAATIEMWVLDGQVAAEIRQASTTLSLMRSATPIRSIRCLVDRRRLGGEILRIGTDFS